MKDPYVDQNGNLINKLGITDKPSLLKRESEITHVKLTTVGLIEGDFDYNHLKRIHKHIFGDLYEWAGKERIIPIEKAEKILNGLSVQYAHPKEIKTRVTDVTNKLHKIKWYELSIDEKTKNLALYTANLWKSHPFREGNTRTTITFITAFAENKGMHMDKEILKKHSAYVRNSLVMASIGDYAEFAHLEKIFKDSLTKGKELRIGEIAYAPEKSELRLSFDKKVYYDVYAKPYLKNNELAKDSDKAIMHDMFKDGLEKNHIFSAMEFSPHSSDLPKSLKSIRIQNLFKEISKHPEMKKLITLNKSLER